MMTAFARTIILYFLIMVGLRLMGKRQIGELEPSELVLTMMISDLATVPMQDFGIPLLAGVIPILTLLAISMLLSQISLRNLRFRAVVCGTPSVLIRNGELQQDAMRRNRYTLDELLEELRGQGISNIADVKYAVLENSGQLSVLPWAAQQPPTASQLGLKVEDDVTLPVIVINDGRVLTKNLALCGKDKTWLDKALRKEKVSSPREVFLMTLDEQGQVLCVKNMLPPVGVLAVILAFALWNSAVITGHTQRWRDQLQQAEALALDENWQAAGDALAKSYEDWSERQVFLHIVSEHEAVDDAEAMYRRAMAFAAEQESSEFRAELADLQDQLRLLAEMERFSLKNVL